MAARKITLTCPHCSRLVRKGIRFSKTNQMHSIVVGLVINVCFFGRALTDFYSFFQFADKYGRI